MRAIRFFIVLFTVTLPLAVYAYPAYNIVAGVDLPVYAPTGEDLANVLQANTILQNTQPGHTISDPVLLLLINPPLASNNIVAFFKFEIFFHPRHVLFTSYYHYRPIEIINVAVSTAAPTTIRSFSNRTQSYGLEIGYYTILPAYRNFEFRVGTSLTVFLRSFHLTDTHSPQLNAPSITNSIIYHPVTFGALSVGAFVGLDFVASKRYRFGMDLQLNIIAYEQTQLDAVNNSNAVAELKTITESKMTDYITTWEHLAHTSALKIYVSVLLGKIR